MGSIGFPELMSSIQGFIIFEPQNKDKEKKKKKKKKKKKVTVFKHRNKLHPLYCCILSFVYGEF
jgi:hypothetical protein